MRFSRVRISELNSAYEIEKTIEQIKDDHRNYEGGWESWASGYETVLLKGAKAKIEQLEKKQYRLAKATCGANEICQGCLYCLDEHD